jgi:hypothetical protein
MEIDMTHPEGSRRDFVKKAIYVPPAIVTLAAGSSFAKNGSDKSDKKDKDNGNNGENGPGQPLGKPGFESPANGRPF